MISGRSECVLREEKKLNDRGEQQRDLNESFEIKNGEKEKEREINIRDSSRPYQAPLHAKANDCRKKFQSTFYIAFFFLSLPSQKLLNSERMCSLLQG